MARSDETQKSRGARTAGVGLVSLLAAGALAFGPALLPVGIIHPATVLETAQAHGEDGPFDLPLETTTKRAQLGDTATFDFASLLAADAYDSMEFSTMRLTPPEEDVTEDVEVTDGGRVVRMHGFGVWRVKDDTVTFTPDPSATINTISVQVTVASTSGYTSRPVTLTARYPFAEDISIFAAEGVATTIDLDLDDASFDTSATTLTLEGMPDGTVLTTDRRRLIVPDQGTWTVSDSGRAIHFEPRRDRLGREPTPVHYTLTTSEGHVVGPGLISVNTPVISSRDISAAYGEPIEFPIDTAMRNVQLTSLELVPYDDSADTVLSASGDTLTVPNQGIWMLQRATGTVTFYPESDAVREVTPAGVRGGDANGNESAIATLSVAYPAVESHSVAVTWGSTATFSPLEGSRFVDALSFEFLTTELPPGTTVTDNGYTLTVPGDGVWSYDASTSTVTFVPEPGLEQSPRSVAFSLTDLDGINSTTGRLNAQYAAAVPVPRDDTAVTNSQALPTTLDVLANDTPATSGQGIDPSSIRLRSSAASNIQELVAGSGTRLVIPDEGTFQVTNAGSVRFTPAPNFVGRTTPVSYTVEDSAGLRSSATIVVEVDPAVGRAPSSDARNSGVNTLLGRLMPDATTPFSMYASITALLLFTGIVSVWVGSQMYRGRTQDEGYGHD